MWFLFTLAVVLLLFAFPRQMSIVLALSALVGGVIGGYFLWQQQQLAAEEDAVEISVGYDLDQCDRAKPLRVTIVNGSKRLVERVEWVFSARRPGYRSELTGDWLAVYSTDEAIAAGQQLVICHAAPQLGQHAVQRETDDPSRLELGIRSRKIQFAD
jgi:hypothetical protein